MYLYSPPTPSLWYLFIASVNLISSDVVNPVPVIGLLVVGAVNSGLALLLDVEVEQRDAKHLLSSPQNLLPENSEIIQTSVNTHIHILTWPGVRKCPKPFLWVGNS